MRKFILLIWVLLPALGVAQVSPSPGLSKPSVVCISTSQALVIASALRRFERLKPAYAAKVQANAAWRAVHQQDSLESIGQTKLIGWYKSNYVQEQGLRQDSNTKLDVARGKARRRGWLVAIEAAGLLLAGYVIITK